MFYNDFYITKAEYRLLKKFLRKNTINLSTLPECYKKLESLKFIVRDSEPIPGQRMCKYLDSYHITEEGKRYIEWHQNTMFKFYLPIVCSNIIAVISVIISLLTSCTCNP